MKNKKINTKSIVVFALLVIAAIFFIIPFLWIITTSLKPESQVFSSNFLPGEFDWSNYAKIFERMPFLSYMQNSIIISIVNIIGIVLSSSIVAYAFTFLQWPGRDKLFYIVLGTMLLPTQVIMIPVFVIFKEIGWLNSLKPLTIPAFFGGGAFNIFLMRQFFLSIPKSLIDAARIDGCSEFRIYATIVMPLTKPAIATVAILTFLFVWNDFLGPLIYLSDKAKGTLALGLAQFAGQQQPEWALLMAASILMMLPIIILFFLFQKYFIRGFMMSGIKE
ncbi:MAG: carbohydrate ABC transporter permease [Ignavibacteria bacterium]|jgi:ABC-type glycerol-3-phosphate transport system permease component